MEDYQLDIMIGEGLAARSLNRPAAVYPDWRHHPRGSLDLARAIASVSYSGWNFIIPRPSTRLQRPLYGAEMSDEGVALKWPVAHAARRVLPTVSQAEVRDYAEVKHDGTISAEIAAQALMGAGMLMRKGSTIWTASCCWR